MTKHTTKCSKLKNQKNAIGKLFVYAFLSSLDLLQFLEYIIIGKIGTKEKEI